MAVPPFKILRENLTFSFYQTESDTTIRTRPMLVNQTFHRMLGQLQNRFPESEDWNWGSWKQTNINHLVPNLRPFSSQEIPTDGFRHILNASSERHGPSWRMVVSLGEEVQGDGESILGDKPEIPEVKSLTLS